MREYKINLKDIKDLLPKHCQVSVAKRIRIYNAPVIMFVCNPSLSEKEFEEAKHVIKELIPKDIFDSFYTEETGHHWYVFLKDALIEFSL